MPAITFTDHEDFQKAAIRAVLGAALGGLVAFAVGLVGIALPPAFLPVAGALAAACGGSWRETLGAGVAGALLGGLPSLTPLHPWFGVALMGAGAGTVLAWARRRAVIGPGDAGRPRPGRFAFALTAVLGTTLALAGVATAGAFEVRGVFEAVVPPFLAAGLQGATLGLFVGLAAAGAHVAADPDPVEALYGAMQAELTGDLRTLALRAATHYRRCTEVVQQSPVGPARTELSRSLSEVTTRILQLARRWQSIDREMGERATHEVEKRIEELKRLRESTRDEAARRQLQVAENTLIDELAQIDRIQRGRERVVARLHAEMAVLERTRFALLGLRSSDTHLRTAELAALSENLTSIAREMDSEAEAVDEVVSQSTELASGRDPARA